MTKTTYRAVVSDQYYVLAPDYPGFGQSEMPARDKFSYTFANISSVIARFTEAIGLAVLVE
jgi:pimeloyl-ACP methyl ester carboxylesterase